ncbi:MATE family efflux transporter [Photobacterium sanguinicancri]|uniref:Multidrug resistance protein NorM n=1 Tax=Photobacterium sanguinicancri TaxID=875932 RepID=A0ABX4FSB4_9GAMM|nr:MATE family efflux transporter [Photobacterium sanguinicancri]OZS41788.1 MATE family efflux transporter [Photobacterium sanguinicancri]
MQATLSLVYQHTKGDFLKKIFTIALPITLQNMMFASKGLVDVMMLGQLTEADIAAVGIASKALFIATIMLVGIATGGGLLTAQYWGAKDHRGVRESTTLSLLFTITAALITILGVNLYSTQIMGLATPSWQVNTLGSQYLVITSFSLFFAAIISSLSASLRSIHQPGICTLISAISVSINILLNWVLIFGNFGAPALGIKGAAIATLLSSLVEVASLIFYLRYKRHFLLSNLKSYLPAFQRCKVMRFLKLSIPTTFNFLIWSAGLFAYHAIMGNSGTQGLVALSVMTPIEAISLSFLVGVANASSVLVGNQLGAKNYTAAYYQAICMMLIAVSVTLVVSLTLYWQQMVILNQFSAITPETRELAETFLAILCVGIVLRSVPTTLVVGVLRAGGDVKFCLYQDMLTQWAFGIPLTALGALWFGFSSELVYAMFFLETLFKWFASIQRFRSKKWMHNLVEA